MIKWVLNVAKGMWRRLVREVLRWWAIWSRKAAWWKSQPNRKIQLLCLGSRFASWPLLRPPWSRWHGQGTDSVAVMPSSWAAHIPDPTLHRSPAHNPLFSRCERREWAAQSRSWRLLLRFAVQINCISKKRLEPKTSWWFMCLIKGS